MTDPEATVSAPGSIVLFGGHSGHYGHPAVAVAIEMRTRCNARLAQRFTVGGEPMDPARHPHARAAVIHGWTDMDRPLALTFSSEAPPEFGLGNETASTVACLGALSMLHDHIIYDQVARLTFQALSEINPAQDPAGISACVHGGMAAAERRQSGEALWTFETGQSARYVSPIDPAEFCFVLGCGGSAPNPGGTEAKLSRFLARSSFARETLGELGALSSEGITALRRRDPDDVGSLMGRSHRLLVNLGMSSPEIDRLVGVVQRHSYGACLTASGGGRCMVALARDAEAASAAITQAGGRAAVLRLARTGVMPED